MNNLDKHQHELRELDMRQNQVIEQLEQLNTRVEQLLQQYRGQTERGAAVTSPPPKSDF